MAAARRSPYFGRKEYQRSPYARRKSADYVIVDRPIVNQIRHIQDHQYHLMHVIGKGSFGEVYSARRLPDRKPVAIKVISVVTHSPNDGFALAQSFLKEVEMTKLLSKTSRHFVEIYDFDFDTDGLSFIVMELGQKNLEAAFPGRMISSAQRKFIWRQLVDMAMALYRHQIVHLDIKPDNILVFPGNMLKLIDMGIAVKAQRTRVGSGGTVPYTAPEITMISDYHRTKTLTNADVWSWGAVLYRLTYGMSPDEKYTPPCDRPPANQSPTRDPHLRNMLHHTLQKDPAVRPDTTWLAHHPYTVTS